MSRSAVLLHVHSEQRGLVVEHTVGVCVAEDRAIRLSVTIVGRRGIAGILSGCEGDRGIDGVVAAGKIDWLEREQSADLICRCSAVVWTGLKLGITDAGSVAVCENVIVAQQKNVS